MERRNGTSWKRWVAFGILCCFAAAFLLPLVWMVATSLKPETQAANAELSLLPDPPSSVGTQAIKNYIGEYDAKGNLINAGVLTDDSINFPLYLRNTLIVATLSVVGMVLSSAIVAYGFARIEFKGRASLFALMLATMMIPFPVLMAPLFILFSEIGWVGTLKPLWVPAWFGTAFNIFLLRQFYRGIPKELDEAARIDGCGHWGIFWKVIVPLSKPALAVVALFHFLFVWNDFLGPLIFITHRDQFTLALGLQLYQSKAGNTPWNLLMAASTMVAAPVLMLFLLTQRTLLTGIAGEGIKG